MEQGTVTVVVQLVDKTRRAQVSLPRSTRCADVITECRKRWSLPLSVDYQLANMRTGRQMLSYDTLNSNLAQAGDVLVLQPFPVHGER